MRYNIYINLFIISLLIVISCLAKPVKAQVLLGPKVGGRMSWLTYEEFDTDEYKKKPIYSFAAGITTAFKVKKRFFLQLDITYSRQGKIVTGITDPTLKNKAIYHYLNTPIIYKMDFKETIWDREFKWFVGAGPNVNFWLNGNGSLEAVELYETNDSPLNYHIRFEDEPNPPDNDALYITQANRVQLGLIVASGLKFEPAPRQTIMVEFRFEWGHSLMAKESGTFPSVIAYQDNLRSRNHGMQLSVSYLIDIFSDGKKEKTIYYKQ